MGRTSSHCRVHILNNGLQHPLLAVGPEQVHGCRNTHVQIFKAISNAIKPAGTSTSASGSWTRTNTWRPLKPTRRSAAARAALRARPGSCQLTPPQSRHRSECVLLRFRACVHACAFPLPPLMNKSLNRTQTPFLSPAITYTHTYNHSHAASGPSSSWGFSNVTANLLQLITLGHNLNAHTCHHSPAASGPSSSWGFSNATVKSLKRTPTPINRTRNTTALPPAAPVLPGAFPM